jgi:hypothetical protein
MAMADNVKVISRISKVFEALDKALRAPKLMGEIAEFIQERIYQNTKRGYYPGTRKNLAKLRPLSPGYIAMRKALLKGAEADARGILTSKKRAKKKAKAKFGEFFSPARSNLTMSGEMLDALGSTIDTSSGQVRIFVEDTQRTDGLSNAAVATKVQEAGRKFLGLDDIGIDRVKRMVIADLRRRLKRR